MNFFDRARSLLKKKSQTADELGEAVAAAREAYDAAKLKAGQERLLHSKHVLASAGEAAKHRELLAQLDGDAHDAEVILAALQERYAEVAAAEAQAAKARRYDEARKQRDEVAARLEAEYDKHAVGLLTLLHLVVQADEAVHAANEDRPEGYGRIETVEELVRDGPEVPRKIIRERVISAWTYPDGNTPLADDLQARVSSSNGHTGHLIPEQNAFQPISHPVVKKRFRQVEYQAGLSSTRGDRLVDMKIPPLRGRDPNYWTPGEIYGRAKPAETLRRLNEVVSGLRAWRPTERPVKVEYVPTSETAAAEAD